MLTDLIPQKAEVEEYSKTSSIKPIVSIVVSTFNHASYVIKCIESILNQKTNFDFDILIGEDASSDDTRIICKELAERHPEKIRLFLHSRENVIIVNGKVTGRFNFLYGLSQARGKYIALCDGDDFWTDPNKLQKQVDFLESHPGYTGSSHWVDILFEGSKRVDYSKFRYRGDITIDKIIKQRWITIQTGSFMFRSEFVEEQFINTMLHYKGGSGDSILFAYLASKGPINSIEEVMSIYRKHNGGRTRLSEIKHSKKETTKLKINSFKGLILLLDEINAITKGSKTSIIRKYKAGLKLDILTTKIGIGTGNLISRFSKKILGI